MRKPPPHPRKKRMLHLHETAAAKRTISKEDIEMFARLTQDESRLHQDTQVALKTGFDRPLAHGMFIDSLVSALWEQVFPEAERCTWNTIPDSYGRFFLRGYCRNYRPVCFL